MSTECWIIVVATIVLAFTIMLLLWIFGIGMSVLYWFTGIFHTFKKKAPPGSNDNNWSREQSSEVK
jgi:fatty acid desaturase